MADAQANQTIIEAAVAASLLAFTAANAGAATATPPAIFALTPALLSTGFLDWSKPAHAKLHVQATKGLDIIFKGKPDQVLLLCEAIQNRAQMCGFNNTIMTIPDDNGIDRDLITEHGMLSYDAIRAWATTNVVGQSTRTAQDNNMLYQCLYNSVSEDVKKKLVPKIDSAKMGKIMIAALYYKCIISTVEVETKATVAHIRMNLIYLKEKIKEQEYDITAFHGYVEQLTTSLASHGKTSEDLTVYLFQAYETVPDEEFKDVIKSKKSEYYMGDKDLEGKDLITYAQKCYDVRSTNTLVPWLQKSKDKVEFEALTAVMNNKMKELKSTNERLAKTLKARVKSGEPKSFKGKPKARANIGTYAWKDIAPKDSDPKTKEANGKTYHWCPKHKAWTLHKPEDCRISNHSVHDAEVDAEELEADNEDDDSDTQSVQALLAAFAMDA